MNNFGLLPDFTPVDSILKRIANERKWAEKDVESDLAILQRHRIVYVHDLRSLSRESWAEIELLPLVKDLLRGAIDPNYLNGNNLSDNSETGGSNNNNILPEDDDSKDKKEKKKDKKNKKDDDEDKKDKKEKKKDKKNKKKGFKSTSHLGTPVKPTILTRPPVILQPQPQQPLNDTSSILSDSSISHDHITMQNTIRNGGTPTTGTPPNIGFNAVPALPTINTAATASVSSGSNGSNGSINSSAEEDDDMLMSPTRRKSVSFSNETAIGVAASEASTLINEKEQKKEKKKDKKDKKDKKKKKEEENMNNNIMASNKCSGYSSFTSHPYTTHPIVKFRKMKLKHCQRLPEVPANDSFLQGIHDKLLYAKIDS